MKRILSITALLVALLLAGALVSCSVNDSINVEKVENMEPKISKKRLDMFNKLNGCEKLYYLALVKTKSTRIPHEDFIEMLRIVGRETGIYPTVVDNFGGTLYPNDTLFNYDFKRWSSVWQCDSVVQLNRNKVKVLLP